MDVDEVECEVLPYPPLEDFRDDDPEYDDGWDERDADLEVLPYPPPDDLEELDEDFELDDLELEECEDDP